jgi:two-component system, chemotaxis family, response regulator WspF
MKLAWICADAAVSDLLQTAVQHRSGWEALWSAGTPLSPFQRPAPEVLLVDVDVAGAQAAITAWTAAGTAVVALVRNASAQQEAVYLAMSGGAVYMADVGTQGVDAPAALERVVRVLGSHRSRAQTTKLNGTGFAEPEAGRQNGAESCLPSGFPKLIALGASAGGPKALARVLSGFPARLPAAVLIALHFEAALDEELVELLQPYCALPVELAEDFDTLRAGRVYVSRTGRHLSLDKRGRISMLARSASDVYCPSIDTLFSSLAALGGNMQRRASAALLTGMGEDGARGLLALKQAGWTTVAQDAASSAVYGMPRRAAELDAASLILPLDNISAALADALLDADAPSQPVDFADTLIIEKPQ